MAHQIPHILVALIICGVLGSVVISAFFAQTVDPSIGTSWFIIPVISIVAIIILFLKTALGDRD